MSFIPPAVEHVAKKIARVPGVEASYIGWDGAVDAVLETAFDRSTRQHVLDIGKRALVPVRVFYRMPDGETIGESDILKNESLEDFYTRIRVAGFADDGPNATPSEIAGDAYGDKDVKRNVDARDKSGQLKLTRIRATTRGRPVIGWEYGGDSLKVGDRVKFKKACCLQWTMGRTVSIRPGMTGRVSQMSSRRPIAFLDLGNGEKVELPIHAAGHVYDVMVDPRLESKQAGLHERKGTRPGRSALTPQMKRLVMTVGFGRTPGIDDTPTNSAHFKGPTQPDLTGYSSSSEEDMIAPKGKGGDDDRSSHVVPDEPKVRVRKNGIVKKKTVLLGRK